MYQKGKKHIDYYRNGKYNEITEMVTRFEGGDIVAAVLAKLRDMRESRSLTLSDLAKATGYKSAKGYRDLELGKIKLTVDHVKALAEFYSVPIEFFFEKEITEKVIIGQEEDVDEK